MQQEGEEIDDGYGEDYSNPVPIGNTNFQIPQANISKPLTDVPSGHKMFGGNETLGSREPYEPSFFDKYIAGPKLKDERALTEDDKGFLDKQTAESEILASDQLAEEENQIADIPLEVDPGLKQAVEEQETEKNIPEIPEEIKESKARNLLAEQLEQNSEVDQDEEAGMTADAAKIDAAGAEAVKADPSLAQQAGGFLKEAFGDLFDPKELARMAILYAGSRALGYSHNGSLRHVGKGYLQRVDAKQSAKVAAAATKEKRAFELAKTDKFTPASVSAYRKSGDPASLVSKKSVAGAVPTGVTETRLIGGKKVSVQQVKLPNGSVGYQIPGKGVIDKAALENNSKAYDASFDKGTSEYRTRRSRATKASADLFKEIQSREGAYKGDDGETKYSTGIIPQQAAQDFWTFAEKYGIDPESDEAQDLMGQAYRQAIEQSKIEDAPRANNLKNFLEAQYIRQQTSAPQLFQVNPDKGAKENPRYVRSDKMNQLTSVIDSVGSGTGAKRNDIIDALVTDWGSADQEQWNRKANDGVETGFYLYAMDKANQYLLNKKLGE